jgi:hypothetical protein
MKKIGLSSMLAVFASLSLAGPALACFDTYCFLQKQGLAYPRGLLAVETSGEYVAQDLDVAGADAFSAGVNVYYGLAERFSVQGALASAEKVRDEFRLDQWGLRGVYSMVRADGDGYDLDAVLELSAATTDGSSTYEFSTPNIWYEKNVTVVVHPVAAYTSGGEFDLRGHGGMFYSVGELGIVGLGSEYESAQSSDHVKRRLVRGAGATSLFLGANLGPNLFLQNEIIKGREAGGSDMGFALTIKFLMPGAGLR